MKERKPGTFGGPTRADAKPQKSGASLSRDIQTKIGKQLRAYYGGLIEPPPDRFVELLRQIDKPGNDATPGDKGSSE